MWVLFPWERAGALFGFTSCCPDKAEPARCTSGIIAWADLQCHEQGGITADSEAKLLALTLPVLLSQVLAPQLPSTESLPGESVVGRP